MIRLPRRLTLLATLIALIGVATSGTSLHADQLRDSTTSKVDGALHQLDQIITVDARPSSQDPRRPFATRTASGRIQVIVEASQPGRLDALHSAVKLAGGRVQLTVGRKIQAELPSQDAIIAIAERSDVRRVRAPARPRMTQGVIVSEGVDIMQAKSWQDAGIDGSGVQIGILDSGFSGYKGLLGKELPTEDRVNVRSFRSDGDIECADCSDSGKVHGRAVAEIVHDIAPGSELFLANFNTDVEMEAAVNWMMDQGVDVINTSFGFLTTSCPYEGEGLLDPVFEQARNDGIFWASSAGNDGQSHWHGTFSDPDGNGFTSFNEDDESQTLRGVEEGEPIVALLWWDDACSGASHDYDIVVSRDGEEIDRSFRAGPTNGWPLEIVSVEAPKGGVYQLRIEGIKPGENQFNMLFLSQRPEHIVPAGSAGLTEPEMSQHVISVGATNLDNQLEPFSSRGPTPDGRIKPEIVAPDGVSNRTFRPFFGTSASSPHVAGAAALVKSAFPDLNPKELEDFLYERAEDLGESGRDGQFGFGLLTLGQPPEERVPAAPSGLNASAAGTSEINLRWQDNAETETGFVLFRQIEDDTKFEEIARVDPDTTTYVDSDLSPATTYCYVVRAFNDTGTSNASKTVCATTAEIQNEPPTADAGSDRTVTIGSSVQLDGTGSVDPEGEPLSYNWSITSRPQSSSVELENAATAQPTFQPDFPGTYTIQLNVTDPQGASGSDTLRIRAQSRSGSGLVALAFEKLRFRPPTAWQRSVDDGCVRYRNVSDATAIVEVTLPGDSIVEFDVPPDRNVVVCGSVVHIDTRSTS